MEPSWDLYRTFLAVLRAGSLTGAAQALGLTQPTVGRHVDELEEALQLSLFTRSRSGLAPTEAAMALRPYAETLAATSAALLRAASSHGEAVAGAVRITASDVVGVEVLPPILRELRERHPGLSIELSLSNRVEDLLRREADIAVRMVAPKQEAIIARRVGTIEIGLHAHPSYIELHGKPGRLDDLAGHAIVGVDERSAEFKAFAAQNEFFRSDAIRSLPLAMWSEHHLVHLAAIRAGVGIGICQVPLARREGLVRVLPRLFEHRMETWIAMHENLRSSPACRAVFDALVEGMSKYTKADSR